MAADAEQVRSVAITLKKRSAELYDAIEPVYMAVQTWILNSIDDDLPTVGQVKSQVEAYEAIHKTPLRQSPDVVEVKTGEAEETSIPDTYHLPAELLQTFDTVSYEYVSETSIRVLSGGVIGSSDGSKLYTIDQDTLLTIPAAISADATGSPNIQPSTFYYLYGGNDANGDLQFYLSDLISLPSELIQGARLRGGIAINPGGSILPFRFLANSYIYDVAIACEGADETEIYDNLCDTATFYTVNCANFVPQGCRKIEIILGGSSVDFILSIRLASSPLGGKKIFTAGTLTNAAYLTYLEISDNMDFEFYILTMLPPISIKMSIAGFAL